MPRFFFFFFFWSLGALTICRENPEIPGRIQMERFIPEEIFREKNNTFRGIRNFLYHLFVLPVPGFKSRASEKFTGILKMVRLIPFLFSVAKKYQYHLTDVFHQIPVQKIYILDNYTGAFRNWAKEKINVLSKTRGKS